MHWVLQSNMFSEEGFGRLVEALTRQDVPYSIHKVVPFSHELVPEIEPQGNVIVMGTYTLVNLARKRGWFPGSFDNPTTFNYKLQAHYWPMLNELGFYMRFGELGVARKPYFCDQPFFIRPVHDTKSFVGTVMDWGHFEKWRDQVLALRPEDCPTITADTEILVAPKREIWREYRMFMVDGIYVTGSLYKFGTIKRYSADVPPWVIEFANEQAKKWVPARAFVMDVAETPDGMFVIEVNNFNSAGWYESDMNRLVGAVEAMVW